MENAMVYSNDDFSAIRDLMMRSSSNSNVADFDERMLVPAIRATLRIWKYDDKLVGFAYVDDYNNLWFETELDHTQLSKLESEIIEWGVSCVKKLNAETGAENTLDCSCNANNEYCVSVLEKHGFIPGQVRSLQYARQIDQPICEYPIPSGFAIRCVNGKEEVESLVNLHRAAFGTNNMSAEYRLAMMSTPQYIREMDFVAVAPNQELAAFCVCSLDDTDKKVGYTDPIGTHPHYQRNGLAKAVISTGLKALKNSGAESVRLGTSSENIAMQKLAKALGFICISEKRWFSKPVA